MKRRNLIENLQWDEDFDIWRPQLHPFYFSKENLCNCYFLPINKTKTIIYFHYFECIWAIIVCYVV